MLMNSFAEIEKNQVYPYLDALHEALIYLMTNDDEFVELIEISTSSPKSVTRRFDKWRYTLENIIGFPQKEPCCFSYKLKHELYDQNPTCAICNQRILHIDDAAIDHIEQYWMGGKTIPENARLVHRFCNAARPRKDLETLGHCLHVTTDNVQSRNDHASNTAGERNISIKSVETDVKHDNILKPMNTQKILEWLRRLDHGQESQAYKIDEMLLIGSSMKQMIDELMKDRYRKRSKQYDESRDEKPIEGRIRRHIDHLRKEHNLRVTNESGIWKIVLAV